MRKVNIQTYVHFLFRNGVSTFFKWIMRQDASSCAISSMEYVKIKLKVEKCIELQKLGQGPFKTCFFKKCIQYSKISSLFLDDCISNFSILEKKNQKNSESMIFSK